jgi:hypothetical protein
VGFHNSASVTKYVGGIFENAFGDPDFGPKPTETGLVVASHFDEPTAADTPA